MTDRVRFITYKHKNILLVDLSNSSAAEVRLGLLDVDSKAWDSAASNLRHVLERDPKHSAALAALGRAEFEQKHYPEAIGLLQRAIANDDSLRVAHYYLGLTYSRVGRKPESGQELQKAIQLEHQETERQRTIFKISDPEPASAPNNNPR